MSWIFLRALALTGVALSLGMLTACAILLCAWIGYLKLLTLFDPLLKLPGSDVGNVQQVMGVNVEEWARKHANTRYSGASVALDTPRNLHFPGVWPLDRWSRLITLDPKVIRHVLSSSNYEKPQLTVRFLSKLFGEGIFCSSGTEHNELVRAKQNHGLLPIPIPDAVVQRKAYSSVFSVTTLISLYPIMLRKSNQLCGLWAAKIQAQDSGNSVVLNVNSWLGRATLDVIASAGFGQDINSVENDKDEVYNAFRSIMAQIEMDRNPFKLFLSLAFPWIHRIFPDEMSRAFDAAHTVILRVGDLLLNEAKCAEKMTSKKPLALLLGVLPKITRLTTLKRLGNFSTFFFNGADSTGSSIAWALHYLSRDLVLQQALRDEVGAVLDGSDRAKALQHLPLLNNIIFETLRIMPPLHSTITMARCDDTIATSEDIVLRDGSIAREIHVKKGQMIHIPLLPLNRLSDIWGQDATKFRPERWSSVPDAAKELSSSLPMMTFLRGTHGCPGQMLALAEMRIFIADIIQNFHVEPSGEEICMFNSFVTRPYVRGKWSQDGPALPLKLTPIIT